MVQVVVIGGGLAGLACARTLHAAGVSSLVLEAADAVGGRVRTDVHRGEHGEYLLDRGFQVLLTAYPEASRVLDYDDLKLLAFYPGALVRLNGEFHRIADPQRRPAEAARGFLSPIASWRDKARLVELFARTRLAAPEALWSRPESCTIERLRSVGFDETTIERFFRPFFGGVFLDRELLTSSRMFEFVFRMFSSGETVLPNNGRGMQAIPEQIAAALPASSVRLGSPVAFVEPGGHRVVLRSGERIDSMCVVIATDVSDARALTTNAKHATMNASGSAAEAQSEGDPEWLGTVTLYFDAPSGGVGQMSENILLLDGDGRGPVNHLCCLSAVAPSYAPKGRALISASVVGIPAVDDQSLVASAISQLREWFGDVASSWNLLRVCRVPRALPRLTVGRSLRPVRVSPGVYAAGDHMTNSSIDGAMTSGRLAAEAVLADQLP